MADLPPEFDRIVEMYGEDPQNVEKLNPILRAHLWESESTGTWIKHPLVNCMFHSWKLANRMFDQKQKAYVRALDEGDYWHALQLVERPWRLPFLVEWTQRGMMPTDDLLLWVWSDTELPEDELADPKYVWLFRQVGFVSDEKPKPTEPIKAYRGAEVAWARGMAWSTDLKVARFFATRFGEDLPVWEAEILPEAVLALVDRRGESEVVVDPALLPRTIHRVKGDVK